MKLGVRADTVHMEIVIPSGNGGFNMRELTLQELEDILVGCAILGTGGGGSLERGLRTVRQDAAAGKTVTLAALSELADDTLVVSPYYAGSVSPLSPEQIKAYEHLPRIPDEPPLVAARALAAYLQTPVGAVLATELGGGNTATALSTAAHLGVPVLDADPAGRAVPELVHSTLYLGGISIAPLAVANQFGDVAVIQKVANDGRAEALVRAMAVVSQNHVGVADHPTTAASLRGKVVEGAISHAAKVGAAWRQAKADGADPVGAVCQAGGGFRLFSGVVSEAWWKDEGGFTVGEVVVKGTGPDHGSEYRIRFKNEHMASWRDGQVDVTVPDLICMFDATTGDPILNPAAREGQPVTIIGMPAAPVWRTEKGLSIFGPAYAGVERKYTPLEEGRKSA